MKVFGAVGVKRGKGGGAKARVEELAKVNRKGGGVAYSCRFVNPEQDIAVVSI